MIDLVKTHYDHVDRSRKFATPTYTNRASSIGGDCERELVYWRTHWQEASAVAVETELIFREGALQEAKVLADLEAAGVRVIEQQRDFLEPQWALSGHIDGVVIVEEDLVGDGISGKERSAGVVGLPLEIKSMSDPIWRSVAKRGAAVYPWSEVAEAFQKKPWLRKYFAQLQVYMLAKNTDQAILLCKNKSTGALAQVNVELDYDYAERLIRRCERINAHVKAGTLPGRIPWVEEICGKCRFQHICRPETVNQNPMLFYDEATVLGWLRDRDDAADSAANYAAMDKKVKDWAWAKDEAAGGKSPGISIGEFLIELKHYATRRMAKIHKAGEANDETEVV